MAEETIPQNSVTKQLHPFSPIREESMNCWRIILAYRATAAEIIITHLTITITVTVVITTTLAAIPAEILVHPEITPILRAIPTVPTMPIRKIMAEHLAIQMVLSHLRI